MSDNVKMVVAVLGTAAAFGLFCALLTLVGAR